MKFKVLNKEIAYDGFFKLHKYTVQHDLFSGDVSEPYIREILDRGNAVAVLVHDPDRDEFVFVKQFRVGAVHSGQPWTLELIAGMVEYGEIAEEVAQREALEEAGVKLTRLININTHYNSVGGCSETTTLFYAQADTAKVSGIHGLDDEHEDIQVVKMSSSELKEKLNSGELNTSSIVMAAYWAMANAII